MLLRLLVFGRWIVRVDERLACPGTKRRKTMTTGRIRQRRLGGPRGARETFDGLPPEVWQVHVLQQKTSWSEQDHAAITRLTRRWTAEQRRRYEEQWNWGRPARWH